MPETHAAPSIVIEDAPAVSNFPLREGEEKHAPVLELDQAMRNESRLQFLEAELAKARGQGKPTYPIPDGPGAENRRRILQAKVKELHGLTRKENGRWSGPCAPFTVVNFNPVPLTLTGGLQDQTIPAANTTTKKVTFNFKGRPFTGSYVTFKSPKVWWITRGFENKNGADVPTGEADYLAPVGIAHQFYQHYVSGAADALGMGGLLIFEGDIHELSKERSNGMAATLRTPVIDSENSTPSKRAYKVEEKTLNDLLQDCLMQQKRYTEAMIMQGHSLYYSQNIEEQKQRTAIHTTWHNYAMDKGWKSEPEEWASEMLTDSPDNTAVKCPGCGTKQPKGLPHFCPNCNAPFDAYASFMAGLPVPQSWLEGYEGEKWEKIVKESARRRDKAALLNPVAETDEAGKKKAKS